MIECVVCSLMRFTLAVCGKVHASENPRPAALQIGDAGGTLEMHLYSNYACMGVPPDDTIGILTQTNIPNRIRKWRNKWQLIRRCSCVLSFLNALSRKEALRLTIQCPNKVSAAF